MIQELKLENGFSIQDLLDVLALHDIDNVKVHPQCLDVLLLNGSEVVRDRIVTEADGRKMLGA